MRLFPGSLLDALRESPGTAAFEHGGRVVTRAELTQLIGRLAAGLRDAGLGPGDGLAIRTTVSPEAFAAHIAAHVVGCRVIGVRPGYAAGQLAHVLGMGVDAVLVDAEAVATTPGLFGAAGPVQVLSLGPCEAARDLLDGSSEETLDITARPDDVALLAFTSGSTGRPKGCATTYRALSEHWAWQPHVWGEVAEDFAAAFERYLLFGTLASMVVFEFLAPCLLGGGTAVIPEDDGRPVFPYAIERHRITGSIITVPKLGRMLDVLRDDPVDVGSLRALMVSGSPLGPQRLAEAVTRLGPVVYNGYGQTETGSVSMLTPADIAAGRLASVGRPHPGVEIRVRDEGGRVLRRGRTGEIYVRAPYMMAGYWGDPVENRDTVRNGWMRTRDLGHLDRDGLLYLDGRARDVIMVNAMVVYAGPVERVLAGHPDVAEAYVVGAPDERTGEAVHAFVVPAVGRYPDGTALKEMAALVQDELGEDSVPQTITAVPVVPTAANGKPDKRALLRRHRPGF
ncbi:acyl-CoA synthetase (AMP-forming)/AMP-acid ligase II [Actinomadura pelletieri DSM 43383]|uniref:Acyl-CoA synthetase (AMP-forming)/AMP-acid ligase II n=1 Tax=Actinomadura pelletieri DSM 43383 TaxID=1120940 RepID=A0A495QI41_9ACTN|nr:AMP-binding protein [Actinomadura pelletieri]RKS71822.1 acyl-CoA synthetase (AMP-forming)/AMP-acid ligase II [Actinomadura pelletieri DSM 43383]